MPTRDSTRPAKTVLAFPAGLNSAVRATSPSSVGEIFAMLGAVAVDTKRDAIARFKAELRRICEWLDMVRMKRCANYAATLTGVSVPLQYSLSPFRQLWRRSSPLAFERLAVLPRRCTFAHHVGGRASLRAIDVPAALPVRPSQERIAAIQARRVRSSPRPTFLAAVLRRVRSVCVHLVLPMANVAGEHDPGSTAEISLSLDRWHTAIIPTIDPHYCDVIVKRWEDFTGQKAVLDAA